MERQALREKIAALREQLIKGACGPERRALRSALASAERDFALSCAESYGVFGRAFRRSGFGRPHRLGDGRFQRAFENSLVPCILLDPRPGVHIIDINNAFAAATMANRAAVAGQRTFEVFPDNPTDSLADGVSKFYGFLRTAAETDQPQQMPFQRYDIRSAGGVFVARFWRNRVIPIADEDGDLLYLLNQVEDVTGVILPKR